MHQIKAGRRIWPYVAYPSISPKKLFTAYTRTVIEMEQECTSSKTGPHTSTFHHTVRMRPRMHGRCMQERFEINQARYQNRLNMDRRQINFVKALLHGLTSAGFSFPKRYRIRRVASQAHFIPLRMPLRADSDRSSGCRIGD
jgi:hypothetical protein